MKGKEQDSRRKGTKKEDRPRQGKDIEHIIHIYIYRKKERGQEGGQVGELGRVEPLRWHVPGDDRGDCQGARENISGRRVKMKTVFGVPFPESVFSIVGGFLIRDLFKILPRRFWALVMPSDERKGTRFKKERNQKRGQSQARKRTRTYIYIYKGRKRGDKRGDRWESWEACSH